MQFFSHMYAVFSSQYTLTHKFNYFLLKSGGIPYIGRWPKPTFFINIFLDAYLRLIKALKSPAGLRYIDRALQDAAKEFPAKARKKTPFP